MNVKSLVGDVLVYTQSGKPCMVLSQEDEGEPKNQSASDLVYGVEFQDGTRRECRQNELAVIEDRQERLSAEALFPNSAC